MMLKGMRVLVYVHVYTIFTYKYRTIVTVSLSTVFMLLFLHVEYFIFELTSRTLCTPFTTITHAHVYLSSTL